VKLQQLRYFLAVVDNGFSVTAAADAVFTSQPGISKQIRLLEDELGVTLFERRGKRLESLTPAGEELVKRVRSVLHEVSQIKSMAEEMRGDAAGELRLATTHTQARYVLPGVIKGFGELHRQVSVNLHQGTSEQLSRMVAEQQVDVVMATGGENLFPGLVRLPVYRWDRVVVVPERHPLARRKARLSLEDLTQYPLVTYLFSEQADSSLMQTFTQASLTPQVAFTARDADIIKTYVRMGMGVGVLAGMAIEAGVDDDLVVVDAGRLFPRLTTWVGFRPDLLLRRYHLDFFQRLAPHLTGDNIRQAVDARNPEAVAELFASTVLPLRAAPGIAGLQAEQRCVG
jgi:LysR family cys regulon transcriptional activator